MTRRTRHSSELGDSWVVNGSEDGDEGDTSYHEEGLASADDEDGNISLIEEPTRRVTRQRSREAGLGKDDAAAPGHATSSYASGPGSSAAPRPLRRSSRAASREPEFIMPSIYEDGRAGSEIGANSSGLGRSTNAPQQSPRKRKTRSGTPTENGGDRQEDKSFYTEKLRTRHRQSQKDRPELQSIEGWIVLLKPVAEWLLDITGGAMKALKTPISYAIALYLFLGLLALVRNFVTNSIYTALSPICRIPGTSLLNLPMCKTTPPAGFTDGANGNVEFDQLMTVQSQFEDILEQSAAGISLPLDMKRGETSIRDLRQIVRFSHLPSRNELVLEFDGFIETARMASFDLQKFNSHVGRAVDNVLATARWTRRVLDDIASARSSRGLIPAFINDRLLAPFQPVNTYNSETALLDQYIQHTRIVEEEINNLISEAQALLNVLTNLEDRLEVIHSISFRDNVAAQASKDEILTHLWTMLGGNRVALGKYNNQLLLLRRVGEYRKTAWAHVSGVVLRLQAMGAELEELRERIGSAELLQDRKDIPLSVHVENIEMGVERLERSRGEAKRLESEHLRRVLDKGRDGDEVRLVEG